MKDMSLEDMNGPQLVELHNQLAEKVGGIEPLKRWSKKVSLLREKIVELQQQLVTEEEIERQKAEPEGATLVESQDIPDHLGDLERFREKTVVKTALNLLCHVVGEGEDGRTYGLSYYEILSVIRELHPNCKTSAACLRWYAVKVRTGEHGYEDYKLVQRRPKSKGQKRSTAAGDPS